MRRAVLVALILAAGCSRNAPSDPARSADCVAVRAQVDAKQAAYSRASQVVGTTPKGGTGPLDWLGAGEDVTAGNASAAYDDLIRYAHAAAHDSPDCFPADERAQIDVAYDRWRH